MGQPIEITRRELSAADLRALAVKTRDGATIRRLLALALLLEGHSREAAARANGMTRQTLRDWVHRYNADGVAELRSGTGPGRPAVLSDEQIAELEALVVKGPDPARHKVMRWRRVDLCEAVAVRWSVRVCEQTIGRWLRQPRMTRLQPRPYHPKKDRRPSWLSKYDLESPARLWRQKLVALS
jgi:transposase